MMTDPITWERLRAIFDNPQPVSTVTEHEFDGFNDKLQVLGRIATDIHDRQELIDARVSELPEILASQHSEGWSV